MGTTPWNLFKTTRRKWGMRKANACGRHTRQMRLTSTGFGETMIQSRKASYFEAKSAGRKGRKQPDKKWGGVIHRVLRRASVEEVQAHSHPLLGMRLYLLT